MADIDLSLAIPSHHAAEYILAHEKFPDARASFLDAVLKLYDGDALLTRLMVEAARQVMFSAILSLDASRDPDNPATLPTLGLLKQQMAIYGLSSPRRIESLLAVLSHSGYLGSAFAEHDRRLRVLKPTEKMRATDRNWWAAQFLPLQVMFPDPGYQPVMQRDPMFHGSLRRAAMQAFAQGAKILGGNPDMMLFMQRDAGVLILFQLAQTAGAPGGREVEPDHKAIAARFGISRTHVQNVVQEAIATGLIATSEQNGRLLVLTSRVWRALDRFLADCMSANDMLFNMSQREFERVPRVR